MNDNLEKIFGTLIQFSIFHCLSKKKKDLLNDVSQVHRRQWLFSVLALEGENLFFWNLVFPRQSGILNDLSNFSGLYLNASSSSKIYIQLSRILYTSSLVP